MSFDAALDRKLGELFRPEPEEARKPEEAKKPRRKFKVVKLRQPKTSLRRVAPTAVPLEEPQLPPGPPPISIEPPMGLPERMAAVIEKPLGVALGAVETAFGYTVQPPVGLAAALLPTPLATTALSLGRPWEWLWAPYSFARQLVTGEEPVEQLRLREQVRQARVGYELARLEGENPWIAGRDAWRGIEMGLLQRLILENLPLMFLGSGLGALARGGAAGLELVGNPLGLARWLSEAPNAWSHAVGFPFRVAKGRIYDASRWIAGYVDVTGELTGVAGKYVSEKTVMRSGYAKKAAGKFLSEIYSKTAAKMVATQRLHDAMMPLLASVGGDLESSGVAVTSKAAAKLVKQRVGQAAKPMQEMLIEASTDNVTKTRNLMNSLGSPHVEDFAGKLSGKSAEWARIAPVHDRIRAAMSKFLRNPKLRASGDFGASWNLKLRDQIAGEIRDALGIEGTAVQMKRIHRYMADVVGSYKGYVDLLAGNSSKDFVTKFGKELQSHVADEALLSVKQARALQGTLGGVLDWLDVKMYQPIWGKVIERYVARPLAEGYLGFTGYGIYNIFEELFRSLVAEVRPGAYAPRSLYRQLGPALQGIPSSFLYSGSASPVAAMVSRGPWSLLPTGVGVPVAKFEPWVKRIAAMLGRRGGQIKELEELVRQVVPVREGKFYPMALFGRTQLDVSRVMSAAIRAAALSKLYRTELNALIATTGWSETKLFQVLASLPDDLGRLPGQTIDELQASLTNAVLSDSPARALAKVERDFITRLQETQHLFNVLAKHVDVPTSVRGAVSDYINGLDAWPQTFRELEKKLTMAATDELATYPETVLPVFDRVVAALEALDFKAIPTFNRDPMTTVQGLLRVQRLMHMSADAMPHRLYAIARAKINRLGAKASSAASRAIWEEADRKVATFLDNANEKLSSMLDILDRKLAAVSKTTKLSRGGGVHAEEAIQALRNILASRMESMKELLSWRQAWFEMHPRPGAAEWSEYHSYVENFWDVFAGKQYRMQGVYAGTLDRLAGTGVKEVFKPPAGTPTLSDLAAMIGVAPSDLTEAALDASHLMSRRQWVDYMGGLADAKQATQYFSDDVLGELYDQILARVDRSGDAAVFMRHELDKVRALAKEIWVSRGQRLLDDTGAEALKRWVRALKREAKDWAKAGRPKNVLEVQQQAFDVAKAKFDKIFVNYDDPTIFTFVMRHFFPYWTYEVNRWPWMLEQGLRHPALILGPYSRYMEYSDRGYLQMGPVGADILMGTLFGPRRLTYRDFPELFPDMPGIEVIDSFNRYSFFVGAQWALPFMLLGSMKNFDDIQGLELGGFVPPLFSTMMNATTALDIPVASKAMEKVRNLVLHERFRDYQVDMALRDSTGLDLNIVNSLLSDPTIDAQYKEGLEQAKWDAIRRVAKIGVLADQTGMIRFRPQELTEYRERVKEAIAAITGVSVAEQERLADRGMSVLEFISLPPQHARVVSYLEGAEFRAMTKKLVPLPIQVARDGQDEFYWKMDRVRKGRYDAQLSDDSGLLSGTIDGRQWADRRSKRMQDYISQRSTLEQEFRGRGIPVTFEEASKFNEKHGYPVSLPHVVRQLLDDYFKVPLIEVNGVQRWDLFYQQREAVRAAVPDDCVAFFEEALRSNLTPMEKLHKAVYDHVLRRYWDVEAQLREKLRGKALWVVYRAQLAPTAAEREEAQESLLWKRFVRRVGAARQALRRRDPELDYWLRFWGVTTKLLTPTAKRLWKTWGRRPPLLLADESHWPASFEEAQYRRALSTARKLKVEDLMRREPKAVPGGAREVRPGPL
jgi:hypothetical protein